MSFTVDHVNYSTTGSNATVTGYSYPPPTNWNLTIPSTVTNSSTVYTVYSIKQLAFESLSDLKSVVIPSLVGTIGDGAFQGCSGLTSITLNNSIAVIENNAFAGCSALTSITLPNSITTIGSYAFLFCTGLTSITIPSTVTTIGDGAFYYCDSLTSVQIDYQTGITSLGGTVFNAYDPFLNKTVLFYLTANYAGLTVYGQAIASYFSSDPSTETNTILYDSNPSCFNEDTKILCLNKNGEEEYIPIQNLRKGDLVKSYLHEYRKIDLIGKGKMFNDPSKFNSCMYIFEKTDYNELIEDLIVTGGHSILVDQLTDQEQLNQSTVWDRNYKIDDKVLLLAGFSSLFKPITTQKIFTWYHFTLECEDNDERFGVFANGVLVEIPSKNQFKEFNIQQII